MITVKVTKVTNYFNTSSFYLNEELLQFKSQNVGGHTNSTYNLKGFYFPHLQGRSFHYVLKAFFKQSCSIQPPVHPFHSLFCFCVLHLQLWSLFFEIYFIAFKSCKHNTLSVLVLLLDKLIYYVDLMSEICIGCLLILAISYILVSSINIFASTFHYS